MAKTKHSTSTNNQNAVVFVSMTFRRDTDWVDWKKPSLTITLKRGGKESTFNPSDRELLRMMIYQGKLEELFPSFRVPVSERWDFSAPIPDVVTLEDVSVLHSGLAFGFAFTVSAGHPGLILGCQPEIEADELFELLENVDRLMKTEDSEKKAQSA